ncbi:UMP kinase [Candidatus Woesearchaeota archaeon]|nr:UMP kinase [Candidatus Woesearchaeota archaeon]
MKTTVISLGGSLIVPEEIDIDFLKKFREVVLDYIKTNRLIIVAGGGGTNRKYNKAASNITKINDDDLDWLGIACTKLNAELLRVIFSEHVYEKIVDDPKKTIKTDKRIIIGSGSVPGFSSDLDSVLLAKNFDADKVINITNVDHVYDKDPRKYEDAKKFDELSWKEYLDIIGTEWVPRLSTPFDPIASKKAESLGITVVIINNNLENIKNLLSDKEFSGTLIK